jgi:hypothetical protein
MERDYRIPIAFGIAILAAAALGFLGWKSYAPPAPSGTATTSTPASVSLQYTKTAEGDRKHTESTEFYDIEATYPDTVGIASSAGSVSDAAALRTVETFISSQIADFKSNQNFDNLTAEDKKVLGFDNGVKYSLGITYEKKESPKTVSLVFTIHVDTGGAHPNTFYQTFTWLKTGKQLSLADIFTPGKPYLSEVSAAAKVLVTKDLEGRGATADAIFEDGFAPTEDNFSTFYLEGKNLVIIFPPYQVAAYAAGTQTAAIPLSSLKNVRAEFR